MDYKKITILFVLIIFIVSLYTRTHLVHSKFILVGEKTMYKVTKNKLIQIDNISEYSFNKANIVYNDGMLKNISFYYNNDTKQIQYFDKDNNKIDYIYDKKYTSSNDNVGVVTNSNKYTIKKVDKKTINSAETSYLDYILSENKLNIDLENIDIFKSDDYYMIRPNNDFSEEYGKTFSIVFKVVNGTAVEIAKTITAYDNSYNEFFPYLYATIDLNSNRGYDAIVLYSKFGEPPKDKYCLYNVNKKAKAFALSDNCEVQYD